jgi:ParB-like chromosome segregation protein Spo0J
MTTSDGETSSSGSLGAVKRLPVADLRPMEGNPRRGQVEVIAESLRVNGQYRPIVVNAGSVTGRRNEVLAGNHTMLAARQLGWESLDVFLVDVDEDSARRIVAVDNRSADLGSYDSQLLRDLLESLDELDGTGYSDADLKALTKLTSDPSPPDDFPSFDDDLETAYCCPKCGYEWSGKPK